MLVENNIKNEIYEKLIEYAFEKCDAIMFVARKDGFDANEISSLDNNVKIIKNKLSNSFLKSRNGSYWVFSRVGYSQLGIKEYSDQPNFNKLFEILFYETTKDVKNYLLTNKDLYAWLNPEYPEDISFFKDGYCWLYSVSHEDLCFIYCENEEEYKYLKSIGIKFVENKFVLTPKEELYYESYIN